MALVSKNDIANHAAGGKKKRRERECLWMNGRSAGRWWRSSAKHVSAYASPE
jgi:hypothetical protein